MLPGQLDKILTKDCQVQKNSRILVAVSGGPDSTALLSLLKQSSLALHLSALYVDHGLRPSEIPTEKEFIRQYCLKLQVPYESTSVEAISYQLREKISLEESCRVLRYRALENYRIAHRACCIAVGHTADDQAEEVLLRLLRGAGTTGLSGMRKRRGSIIRPLLDFTKQQLLEYLEKENIGYCVDSSNSNTRFLRNRIRHNLLPLIEKEFNPAIRTTLLQSADILREEDTFLQDIVEEHFAELTVIRQKEETAHTAELALPLFLKLHRALRRRILEKICTTLRVSPSFVQIAKLEALADNGKTGKELHLGRGLRAVRKPSELLFCFTAPRASCRADSTGEPLTAPIRIEHPVSNLQIPQLNCTLSLTACTTRPEELPTDALLLDAERITFPLLLRHHRRGERFHPAGAPGSKKVARFLTDKKIPQQERRFYPVLLQNSEKQDAEDEEIIIAIPGLRAAECAAATVATRNVLLLQWRITGRNPDSLY